MPDPFITTRRVEFCDTDMAGIVHFANFYRYMEQTEHEFFRSIGLPMMREEPDGSITGWPRVSASCSFEAPAFYNDILECRLDIDRVGVKSVTYKVEFWRDGKRLAHGSVKTVCCRFGHGEKMRSIEIPPEYLRKLDPNWEPLD